MPLYILILVGKVLKVESFYFSMFVLLKGATKEQSFKIGQEIAEAVTATNPKPVKLKFEKVRGKLHFCTKRGLVSYCNLDFIRNMLGVS